MAGAVKPKQLAAAKAMIPEGSAHQANFVAQIEGTIIKGESTAEATSTRQPRVDATSIAIVADVLRRLKAVDPALSLGESMRRSPPPRPPHKRPRPSSPPVTAISRARATWPSIWT